MNREIKFRVWDGKKFTEKDCYINSSTGKVFSYEEDYGGTFSSHKQLRQEKWVAQQFIGLKDKNGREIYEGDIVSQSQVVYSDCIFGFVLNTSRRHNIDEKYGDYAYIHKDRKSYYEVIGNIFENPELK